MCGKSQSQTQSLLGQNSSFEIQKFVSITKDNEDFDGGLKFLFQVMLPMIAEL